MFFHHGLHNIEETNHQNYLACVSLRLVLQKSVYDELEMWNIMVTPFI